MTEVCVQLDSSTRFGYVRPQVLNDHEILELRACVESVERAIESGPTRHIRRIVAVAETASTQDTAAALAGSESGVLVIAGRQTAGRGRLGRVWTQREGLGVAATLAITVPESDRPYLSLAAGVGVARAIEDALGLDAATAATRLGIRWPNDVVEVSSGRKLAGILIESRAGNGRADPVLLVGVGINVAQGVDDWPPELAERAMSIRQLGGSATRAQVLAALVARLDQAVDAALDPSRREELLSAWKSRDVLLGTRAVFELGRARLAGVVESLEPTLEITLRQPDGLLLRLPAATTSLIPVVLRGSGRITP